MKRNLVVVLLAIVIAGVMILSVSGCSSIAEGIQARISSVADAAESKLGDKPSEIAESFDDPDLSEFEVELDEALEVAKEEAGLAYLSRDGKLYAIEAMRNDGGTLTYLSGNGCLMGDVPIPLIQKNDSVIFFYRSNSRDTLDAYVALVKDTCPNLRARRILEGVIFCDYDTGEDFFVSNDSLETLRIYDENGVEYGFFCNFLEWYGKDLTYGRVYTIEFKNGNGLNKCRAIADAMMCVGYGDKHKLRLSERNEEYYCDVWNLPKELPSGTYVVLENGSNPRGFLNYG